CYDRAFLAQLEWCRDVAVQFIADCADAIETAGRAASPDGEHLAYDIVGFSSTFQQNIPSLALARELKRRHPGVKILFGGANCEDEMGRELHRSFPFLDVVCSGEAD